MPRRPHVSFLLPRLIAPLVAIAAAACSSQTTPVIGPTASALALDTEPRAPAAEPPTIVPDDTWSLLRPGLERRVIRGLSGPDSGESLYVLRIDPGQFDFEVAYQPGAPLSLEEWHSATGAEVVVNAGFFDSGHVATALTVVDGRAEGRSYVGFGGMFAVTPAGVELRWLTDRPYSPEETLLAAVQSSPMLLARGGEVVYTPSTTDKARRTVVAMDTFGRPLLIAAPDSGFTLSGLARTLGELDFAIDSALNLDGGKSTGLFVSQPREVIPALSRLPAVILVRDAARASP